MRTLYAYDLWPAACTVAQAVKRDSAFNPQMKLVRHACANLNSISTPVYVGFSYPANLNSVSTPFFVLATLQTLIPSQPLCFSYPANLNPSAVLT
jgi:hypothetical protein